MEVPDYLLTELQVFMNVYSNRANHKLKGRINISCVKYSRVKYSTKSCRGKICEFMHNARPFLRDHINENCHAILVLVVDKLI